MLEKLLEEKIEHFIKNGEVAKLLTETVQKLDLLLTFVVIQQKDVCSTVKVDPDTVRRKALAGEIEILQRDGSSQNYITLKTIEGLKARTRRRKRRGKKNFE